MKPVGVFGLGLSSGCSRARAPSGQRKNSTKLHRFFNLALVSGYDGDYRILEIEPGASLEQIRQAYNDQTKVWHPDRFADDIRLQKKAEEKLKQINLAYRVASRILCKRLQRVFGPVLVHSVKDTVKDPFAAVASAEGAHGADASAHFHKESFNHVGGAQSPALRGWKPEDREEFFQVGFQAVHGTRSAPLPALFPFSKAGDRFLFTLRLIDEFGFL